MCSPSFSVPWVPNWWESWSCSEWTANRWREPFVQTTAHTFHQTGKKTNIQTTQNNLSRKLGLGKAKPTQTCQKENVCKIKPLKDYKVKRIVNFIIPVYSAILTGLLLEVQQVKSNRKKSSHRITPEKQGLSKQVSLHFILMGQKSQIPQNHFRWNRDHNKFSSSQRFFSHIILVVNSVTTIYWCKSELTCNFSL